MNFYIKTGTDNMQVPAVCDLLHTTYWAKDRPHDIIEKSLQKSDCIGAFLSEDDRQIGFARIITDDVTMYYLCDVVVDEKYRGQGVGKKMMEAIKNDLKYRPIYGLLGTENAHGLYEKIGFVRSGDATLMKKPKGV